MILYHGSSTGVRSPKLLVNQRELDFGKGFYTTDNFEQAARWARRTAARLRLKDAFVTVYSGEDAAMSGLRVLSFEKPDENRLRFVADNRKGIRSDTAWDIVIGPVANDQTMPVIDLYLDGMYDEQEAIKRLLPQKLKDQYTFKTEAALRLLQCTEVIPV
jgi:hypothetical protein